MKVFEAIKRFIRKIFIDYYEIDKICNNNIKMLEEKIANNNANLKKELINENERTREQQQILTNSIINENTIMKNQINNIIT